MQLGQWQDALTSFLRIVSIKAGTGAAGEAQGSLTGGAPNSGSSTDEDNISSVWNNIASIHWHQGHPAEALRAFLQAARLAPESWKIWDNVVTVALECQQPSVCVHAMERLVALKGPVAFDLKAVAILLASTAPERESKSINTDIPSSQQSLGQVSSGWIKMLHSVMTGEKMTNHFASDPMYQLLMKDITKRMSL